MLTQKQSVRLGLLHKLVECQRAFAFREKVEDLQVDTNTNTSKLQVLQIKLLDSRALYRGDGHT